MPELAEVEYYRKRWDCGLGQKILRTALHPDKRIFRGTDVGLFQTHLPGSRLVRSEARGKQMLFEFSGGLWLGLHLGMTGKLLAESPAFRPAPHDHLVLFQEQNALVFRDPRLFGRVRFHSGNQAPEWWTSLPVPVNSPEFKRATMERFFSRHERLPVKAALLLQSGFPGVGNWMADEILWRAQVHPELVAGCLGPGQLKALWKSLRFVCRGALKHVSHDFSDPPEGWLFQERWGRGGRCPIHRTPLQKKPVRGRSTAWCPACQPKEERGHD